MQKECIVEQKYELVKLVWTDYEAAELMSFDQFSQMKKTILEQAANYPAYHKKDSDTKKWIKECKKNLENFNSYILKEWQEQGKEEDIDSVAWRKVK